MDIQIQMCNGAETYSSGDSVSGKIRIYCGRPTTIFKLTATLVGESTSLLTGSPGLLFSRREEETHTFLREECRIFPTLRLSKLSESRPLRLDVGCHSFDFQLRIPWVQDCSSCPTNTANGDNYGYETTREKPAPTSMRELPPSTSDLQMGNRVAYRVDAAVTTMRNMFKSRTLKTCSITVWPIGVNPAQHSRRISSQAEVTARATILGPNSLPLPSYLQAEEVLGLAPAKILISATFQPNFQLVKTLDTETHKRKVKMDLSVTKLNQHSQDLYLQSFQMLLVGYTGMRAGAATHGYMSFWTLQSLSNIGLQVFKASDVSGTQRAIDKRLWEGVVLDDSVVPHFETCNLDRRYELEVLLGWQCQTGEHAGRVFFVQARTPVRISSGIERNRPTEKQGDLATTTSCKESQAWVNEERRRPCLRFSEPPSYDEAVRTAVDHELKGSKMRNGGGW